MNIRRKKMISRKNYKKVLAKKERKKLTTKSAVLASLGIVAIAGAVPAMASTWVANTPESIQIKENDTSYTMVYGDTLWAISMKINVNVQTLASINNIDLSAGEEYHLAVGTVIKWDKRGTLFAETANGQQITGGIKTNDSNKIIPNKPIGEDVTNDVKDNNITDSQINGKPDNTGKDAENAETKPTDKWSNLFSKERKDGSHILVGPFNNREDADEYFDYKGYRAGNIFSGTDEPDYFLAEYNFTPDKDKWYLDVLMKDTAPIEPEEPVTPPTEPSTPDPAPTEPTEPEQNVGTVTMRYVNHDGEEIKEPTIMTGEIDEMFNAVPDNNIGEYTIEWWNLPEGAVSITDGSVVARNAYTQEPQTYTFIYSIRS